MDAFVESPQRQSADSDTSPASVPSFYRSFTTSLPTGQSASSQDLHSRSCHTCRRRKVKCDKLHPCSNCTKARIECVFPGPGRAPRRVKPPKSTSERETELLKRLRRLEGVVEELSGQVEVDAAVNKDSPASSRKEDDLSEQGSSTSASRSNDKQVKVAGMDAGTDKKQWMLRLYGLGEGPPASENILQTEMGKVVIDEGRSRYVGSDFWARLNLEVEDVREQIDEFEDESSVEEETPNPALFPLLSDTDHHSFILGYSSSNVDLFQLHPLPSQIPFYWDIYCENVDPLCKITHIPTVSKIVKEARDKLKTLSPSTEALMFSMYFAAVTSLTEDEVKANFGVDRKYLLVRYRFGTEQALAKAGFLNTSEMVTLQAFVIFLVCVRRHDIRHTIWSLVGLAIRIAQSLGLHRDGTALGLSPFETEIRRRLWWHIVVLDIRASDDYGFDPAIMDYTFDCKLPLNLNDTDIDPSMSESPAPREGISEMTFCLIRYEILTVNRRLIFTPPAGPCFTSAKSVTLADKEKMIKDLSDHLETTYLKFCDNAGPLFWVAATVARLVISKMTLVIYGLRAPGTEDDLPLEIRNRLLVASIEILEYTRLLESEGSTKKWGWLFHTYVQWHAIAYVLREVCIRPPCPGIERGWQAVNSIFESWAEALRSTNKKGLLWVTMRKLMIKAKRKRQADIDAAVSSAAAVSQDALSTELYMPPPPNPPQGNNLDPALLQGHIPTLDLGVEVMFHEYTSATNPPWNINPNLPNTSANMQGVMTQPVQNTPAPDHFGLQMPGLSSGPTQNQIPKLNIEPGQSRSQSRSQSQPSSTWLFDDPALTDLDMNSADSEINWEGWDEVVRSFQMELDQGVIGTGGHGMQW